MVEKQTLESNLGKRHHGADVMTSSVKYGIDPSAVIDFSSNVNIFSCEIDYHKVISYASKAINSYPDIEYTNLREKLSKVYNADKKYIIPGNGATELIYLVMRLPGINNIGIFTPTFCEYKRAAQIAGKHVKNLSFALLNKNNNALLEKEIKELDLIVICNPNNPTGEIKYIDNLVIVAKQNNIKILTDETFIGFTENTRFSMLDKIEEHKNLIVLKAATKLHAVPGLRLGYAFTSDEELIELMWSYKEPWSINVFAEPMTDYIYCSDINKKTKEYYTSEIIRLKKLYMDTGFISCSDTTANFIMLKFKDNITSHFLKKHLIENHNMLIRDCSDFEGLDSSYIRVAIKEKSENDELYKAIQKVINDKMT